MWCLCIVQRHRQAAGGQGRVDGRWGEITICWKAVSCLGKGLVQLTRRLVHANELKGCIEEGTEEVEDGSDECGLIGRVLCLPFVGPRKDDVERGRLWVGEWSGERDAGRGRTERTCMPLSSASFQVFPTEKEPLVLSFDLCMKPVLSVAPGWRIRRVRVEERARTGDDDVAWLFSLALWRVLPYLYVSDVGLEDVGGSVALVEDGGDDALPGAIVVGHGKD